MNAIVSRRGEATARAEASAFPIPAAFAAPLPHCYQWAVSVAQTKSCEMDDTRQRKGSSRRPAARTVARGTPDRAGQSPALTYFSE